MGQSFIPDDAACTQAIYTDLQDNGHFTVLNSYEAPDLMG